MDSKATYMLSFRIHYLCRLINSMVLSLASYVDTIIIFFLCAHIDHVHSPSHLQIVTEQTVM